MDRKCQFFFVWGLGLFLYGAGSLFFGWREARIAPREATAVGTINYVHHGKGSYYEYTYRVDGQTYSNNSGSCRTPLFHGMCKVGSRALVYYDRSHPGTSLLNEYGAESRFYFDFAEWMVPVGALLLLGAFVYYRMHDSPPSEVDVAEEDNDEDIGPEVLHVVPTDKS